MATWRVGQSRVNASDISGLRRAWRNGSLVPFLGAGISVEHGVPSWRTLVLELLFEESAHLRSLRAFGPHHTRALASWLADYFEYDPVILSRVVKNATRRRGKRNDGLTDEQADQVFLHAVRKHLYASRVQPAHKTSLHAVADLIERGVNERRIRAVVTFNFDDLLEQELARRKVPFHVVTDGRRSSGRGLPIVHPHGYLPREGPLSKSSIVFTEDDYHRLTDTVFHWALTEIVSFLRHQTVLFLGLSMSDPNLRRLLDASYVRGDVPAHWLVMRKHALKGDERQKQAAAVEERARRHAAAMGLPDRKEPERIEAALEAALKLADRYDRELLESMGVKTVWIEEFADLRPLLEAIR